MKKSPIRAWFSSISTHDFLPRSNRVFSPLRTPLAWFVIAGVTAGLIGAIVAPQGWVVCGIIFGAMLLGMAWPWLAMRGLRAAIHFDRRRCHELNQAAVVLTVTNRWPWPVWGLLIERGFFSTVSHPGNPQRSATTALAQVTGWSNSRFEFSFEPPRRGIYPFEQPLLVTGFPFGLWNVKQAITVSQQLIVWPRTTDLRSLPMQSGDRLATSGRYVDRPGHDGDIIAARPYIRGDSLRRIHWVHTARRDTLIVCERQTASQMGFTILLDPYAFAGNERGLDWALRVVASLCREFHNHACQLICQLGKDQYVISSGAASLHRLFDRLAAYNGSAARTDASVLRIPTTSNQQTILVTSAARWHEFGRSEMGARHKSSVRAVVLEENAQPPSKHAASQRRGMPSRPWIELSLENEPSRELQRQWERQCHDDWAQ